MQSKFSKKIQIFVKIQPKKSKCNPKSQNVSFVSRLNSTKERENGPATWVFIIFFSAVCWALDWHFCYCCFGWMVIGICCDFVSGSCRNRKRHRRSRLLSLIPPVGKVEINCKQFTCDVEKVQPCANEIAESNCS